MNLDSETKKKKTIIRKISTLYDAIHAIPQRFQLIKQKKNRQFCSHSSREAFWRHLSFQLNYNGRLNRSACPASVAAIGIILPLLSYWHQSSCHRTLLCKVGFLFVMSEPFTLSYYFRSRTKLGHGKKFLHFCYRVRMECMRWSSFQSPITKHSTFFAF